MQQMTLHLARKKPLRVITEAAPLQISRLRLCLCQFLPVFFSPFCILLSFLICDLVSATFQLAAQGSSKSDQVLNLSEDAANSSSEASQNKSVRWDACWWPRSIALIFNTDAALQEKLL